MGVLGVRRGQAGPALHPGCGCSQACPAGLHQAACCGIASLLLAIACLAYSAQQLPRKAEACTAAVDSGGSGCLCAAPHAVKLFVLFLCLLRCAPRYGLYYGILARDSAEVISDRIAAIMAAGRKMAVSVRSCGICGGDLPVRSWNCVADLRVCGYMLAASLGSICEIRTWRTGMHSAGHLRRVLLDAATAVGEEGWPEEGRFF